MIIARKTAKFLGFLIRSAETVSFHGQSEDIRGLIYLVYFLIDKSIIIYFSSKNQVFYLIFTPPQDKNGVIVYLFNILPL